MNKICNSKYIHCFDLPSKFNIHNNDGVEICLLLISDTKEIVTIPNMLGNHIKRFGRFARQHCSLYLQETEWYIKL